MGRKCCFFFLSQLITISTQSRDTLTDWKKWNACFLVRLSSVFNLLFTIAANSSKSMIISSWKLQQSNKVLLIITASLSIDCYQTNDTTLFYPIQFRIFFSQINYSDRMILGKMASTKLFFSLQERNIACCFIVWGRNFDGFAMLYRCNQTIALNANELLLLRDNTSYFWSCFHSY